MSYYIEHFTCVDFIEFLLLHYPFKQIVLGLLCKCTHRPQGALKNLVGNCRYFINDNKQYQEI